MTTADRVGTAGDGAVGGSMVGLFAGIGGLELGLARHGWRSDLLCEIDPAARAVLAAHFPDVRQHGDIARLRALPADTELVAAGFPCQDLSQAGRTAGIAGARSGLVGEVFRLLRTHRKLRWLVIENVPFMVKLARGNAMLHITDTLADMGFTWAYRIVDARSFGLPQRRNRVVLLASRTEDPRAVLFADDASEPPAGDRLRDPCGFYWTEGLRGLGWAVAAVPTLKGGSGLGIPSPPAVLLANGEIVTPGISDAERLQGFPAGWTAPALQVRGFRPGGRWRLVGNAVSVRMADWVGERLAAPGVPVAADIASGEGKPWPAAAWGHGGKRWEVGISPWPVRRAAEPLTDFLTEARPLSVRATAGFLRRARASRLRFPADFLDTVQAHLDRMSVLVG